MVKVKNIYDKINKLAPFSYQEKWDNSGLLVGDSDSKVEKILLSLDITNDVVSEAVNGGYDMVVSHHPVIFHPLKTLSNEEPAVRLAKNNISAICAHTNLDIARGGINDIIAEKLDAEIIDDTFDLSFTKDFYQLSVFVPVEDKEKVVKAMCNAGAGILGEYKDCFWSVDGTGSFVPLDGAQPYIGDVGKREEVKEARVELVVPAEKRYDVISVMLEAHPYEKAAYNLFENKALVEKYGFGKVCRLKKSMSCKDFALMLKEIFGSTVIKYNETGKMISTFAYCSGGGGSLVDNAIERKLDAYFTGDVKHDQFIGAVNNGLALFDCGHFHTETIVLEYLKKELSQKFKDIKIDIAKANKDIVSYLM